MSSNSWDKNTFIWGESELLQETVDEISYFLGTIPKESLNSDHSLFSLSHLINQRESPQSDCVLEKSALEEKTYDNLDDIVSSVVHTLNSGEILNREIFSPISPKVLKVALHKIQTNITEEGFVHFCETLISWDDDHLEDLFFSELILLKALEKEEASQCIVHAMKDLTTKYPNQMCNQVISSLLDEDNFVDSELLSAVYSSLGANQKDFLISQLLEKDEWCDHHWELATSLVTSLTLSSTKKIIHQVYSSLESLSSKSYFKFLFHLCKNLKPGLDEKCIHILKCLCEESTSLMKKQAIKALDTYEG